MLTTDKIVKLGLSSRLLFGTSRKTRLVSASALFLAACAFGAAGVAPMAPDPADLPVRSISEDLAIPTLVEQIAVLQADQQTYLREERVRSGDTLAALLQRLGVDDQAATAFITSDRTARNVMQLRPGRRVQAETTRDGQLHRLIATYLEGGEARNLIITRDGESFTAKEVAADLERRIEMHSGEIRSSLFAATDAARIPDPVALQIVDMFSTNIDFASDLRRGDQFGVVYETFWQDGEYVRSGRVLAGEFVNAGKRYQSVWFEEPGTKGGYYTFDGKSLKKAFLKSPLEFSRISSGFSMRVHPISGKWKRHQGVDFAAPTGTPIRAAADGSIEFIGRQGGYGNFITIKHWNNITTAYAHMSRFAKGLHRGSKVAQGQVIGYVGTTGWSTGPHLHYEFRVNNVPRDPMSIDIPNTQTLTGAELQRFKVVAGEMSHRFALLNSATDSTKLAAR